MWSISYYDDKTAREVLELPETLLARYLRMAALMEVHGPNLGMPHTKAMGNGLFELRLQGKEGIARVFYCMDVKGNIVMLHSFVKKTQETPDKELYMAQSRMKEVKKWLT